MNQKSKDKLKFNVSEEVTMMFQEILNYAEVACPTKDVYSNFRSKVLRIRNDCIRNLHKNIDRFYEVKYIPNTEEVIEVKR